jgi:hypothetical protein
MPQLWGRRNGVLEHADSVRNAKLYDRTSDEVSLDEIEKIII